MTDVHEYDVHRNKRNDKTYFSPRIAGGEGRHIRIASKVMDGEALAYALEKGELVLRRTPKGRKEIIAKFLEDDRRVGVLTIQSFNPETGGAHNTYFSFIGDEIPRLLAFFETVRDFQFEGPAKVNITDEELKRFTMSKAQAAALIHDNQELFAEVMKSAMTRDDIVAFAYRRKQVEAFGRLLEDRAYFDEVKTKRECTGDEAVWQRFFEKNEWIFGYGLSYLYVSGINPEKLEQAVKGFDMLGGGKRADAVMRTRGMVSALCFAEIKTHETDLTCGETVPHGLLGTIDRLGRSDCPGPGDGGSGDEALGCAFSPAGQHRESNRPRSLQHQAACLYRHRQPSAADDRIRCQRRKNAFVRTLPE